MKILVAGGAGFIGSHLCDLFIEKGHSVVCVDNLLTSNLSNIEHLKNNSKFKFINQDICEPLDLKDSLDYILHFASPASPKDYYKYPIETLKVGSVGTINLLNLAKEKKTKFLLASTSEVYGDPEVSPQPEEYWGRVNPIGERSCYDESKRFAEAYTVHFSKNSKLDARIIRIFNTYGPRMKPSDGRAIPNFVSQALRNEPLTVYGEGRQTRSFCFVTDLIAGIYSIINHKDKLKTPINLGNPHEISLLELAEKIISISQSNSKIEFRELPSDDPQRRKPDISKANKLLAWGPKVLLEDGLQSTIKWFADKI